MISQNKHKSHIQLKPLVLTYFLFLSINISLFPLSKSDKAPPILLGNDDGSTFNLRNHIKEMKPGDYTAFAFFSVTCKPCSKELSELNKFREKFGKKGFICANAGVNVMLRILKRLLIMKKEALPTKGEISKLLTSVADYFKKTYYKKDKPNTRKLSDIRKKCASEAGRGDVEKELWDALVKENPKYAITG